MEEDIECSGFFAAQVENTISCLDKFEAGGPLRWVAGNFLESFYNFGYALTHPGSWLGWMSEMGGPISTTEAKQSLLRFVYYGGSIEFFFVIFTLILIVTAVGLWRNQFMWGCVRVLEGIANSVGRSMAWAGLVMVLIQIVIIFLQRVFAVSEIGFAFGIGFTFDVSWWSESLKFYNALIVALCVSYTFVQGGHVRVDLVYSAVSYRTKKLIDMLGAVFFMFPAAVLVWLYGWYFLWRHMMTPNISASDTLEKVMRKAPAVRWNVETIGFSPNGFNAYFLFKMLLLAYTALVLMHAVAFFYRSYLERKEGPDAEGKYLNKDNLGDAQAELVAEIH